MGNVTALDNISALVNYANSNTPSSYLSVLAVALTVRAAAGPSAARQSVIAARVLETQHAKTVEICTVLTRTCTSIPTLLELVVTWSFGTSA